MTGCERTLVGDLFVAGDVSVGARLARDESDAVLQEPRCLFREQALLPQPCGDKYPRHRRTWRTRMEVAPVWPVSLPGAVPQRRLPSQGLALVGQLYVLQLHAQLRHFIKQ